MTRWHARWRASSAGICPASRSSWCATWRARGGLAAANFLFNGAEKDGSHIGLLQNNARSNRCSAPGRRATTPTKFNWLGTPSVETGLFVVWNAVPVDSLDDAKTREITVGAAGAEFDARLPRAAVQ